MFFLAAGLLVAGAGAIIGAEAPLTGWRAQLAPLLEPYVRATGIPLGFLLGWIEVESGGRLHEVSSLGEAGYFQLMPGELPGVDQARLSEDPEYSISEGIRLVLHYRDEVLRWGWPLPSSGPVYWAAIKLCHTFGPGIARAMIFASPATDWAGTEESALEDAPHWAAEVGISTARLAMHLHNIDRVLAD